MPEWIVGLWRWVKQSPFHAVAALLGFWGLVLAVLKGIWEVIDRRKNKRHERRVTQFREALLKLKASGETFNSIEECFGKIPTPKKDDRELLAEAYRRLITGK